MVSSPILTNIPSTTWRYRNEFRISRLLEVPQYSTFRLYAVWGQENPSRVLRTWGWVV